MSLFGIGGPAGYGGLNGFDCMILQSNKDRTDLENQCRVMAESGLSYSQIKNELSFSDIYSTLIDSDKKILNKKIEKICDNYGGRYE